VKTRQALLIAATAAAWLAATRAARAEEPRIVSVLDERAFAIARFDLEKIELAPVYEMLDSVRGLQLPPQGELAAWLAGLRQAGGKQLYVTWGGEGFGIAFVAPAEGAAAKQLVAAMTEAMPQSLWTIEAAEPIAGGVAAGRRSMLLALRKHQAQPRPHLAEALAATDGAAVQVVLVPDDATRNAAESFAWPFLGTAATARATRNLAWASIGLDGPSTWRLKLRFAARDAGAVEPLKTALAEAIAPLLDDPQIQQNVALIERLRELLAWRQQGNALTLDLEGESLALVARAVILPAVEAGTSAASRKLAVNQLKQIVIALHNHHDAFKRFPPAVRRGDDQKPLLSWRVALLPFLEQQALYKQFDLNEPWDSPKNKPLVLTMPEVYRCPLARVPEGHTVYLTPRGEGTVFPEDSEGTPIRQIIDGTSKTIAVLEVDDAFSVPWTSPEDWPFDPDQPTRGLGGHFGNVFLTGFCDGSMHVLQRSIDTGTFTQLLTRAGREPVSIPH
jgi:hypothetical protein